MKVPFSNLYAQYLSIKTEIDKAIASVVEKSAFIGTATNPFIKEFEEGFAKYAGIDFCISCANGTDAIEIALKALGIGLGDEVIVPALTWISTAEAVSNVGAIPVFADIDPDYFTISIDSIKERINTKTKAIIPVHLYGQPADMPEIIKLAKEYNLKIIEDCAQAHGALIDNKNIGTFGDIATFSFFPGKNLGAFGDAGGIVTQDPDLAKKCRMISQHGQLDKKHQHYMIGRNSRMDGINAAVLAIKLNAIEEWTEKRKLIAEKYLKKINNPKITLPKIKTSVRHVFHLFILKCVDRVALTEYMDKNNIEYAIQYPKALPLMDIYKSGNNYPDASSVTETILSIPLYPEMTDDMVQYVIDKLNNF